MYHYGDYDEPLVNDGVAGLRDQAARRYGPGCGHVTTRRTIRYKRVRQKDAPAILAELASVQMHAVRISGNHVRNATTERFTGFERHYACNQRFAHWVRRNTRQHKIPGLVAVTLAARSGTAMQPGEVTAAQMEQVAAWAQRFGFGEIRIAHEQNVILPDIRRCDLFELWKLATAAGLAAPNVGPLSDLGARPQGCCCAPDDARSRPIANAILQRFEELDYVADLGGLSLHISSCAGDCGHRHMGNIGILGIDMDGEERYQVTLGGAQGNGCSLGKAIGPAFRAEEMPGVVERIVAIFCQLRLHGEAFIATLARVGLEPFEACVYEQAACTPESIIHVRPECRFIAKCVVGASPDQAWRSSNETL